MYGNLFETLTFGWMWCCFEQELSVLFHKWKRNFLFPSRRFDAVTPIPEGTSKRWNALYRCFRVVFPFDFNFRFLTQFPYVHLIQLLFIYVIEFHNTFSVPNSKFFLLSMFITYLILFWNYHCQFRANTSHRMYVKERRQLFPIATYLFLRLYTTTTNKRCTNTV